MKTTLLTSIALMTSSVFAENYGIDVAHTGLNFAVKHMVISKTKGEFKDFSGSIDFDGKDLKSLKFDVVVNAKSIDTKNAKRDDHLRSPDFFDAEKYPQIKFVSKEVKNVKGNAFDLVGTFTIKDVSKEVVIPMTYNGTVQSPWGQTVIGFEGGFAVDRMEYGLTWNKMLEAGGLVVDKNVEIDLAVEAVMSK